MGIYAVAINQGTFCHEPGDVLQSTRARNAALARADTPLSSIRALDNQSDLLRRRAAGQLVNEA
jgi:hypothetical protein